MELPQYVGAVKYVLRGELDVMNFPAVLLYGAILGVVPDPFGESAFRVAYVRSRGLTLLFRTAVLIDHTASLSFGFLMAIVLDE